MLLTSALLATLATAQIEIRPEDYYTPADGADWSPVFDRALASTTCNGAVPRRGCVLRLACATYETTRPIELWRQSRLQGCQGQGWGATTTIAPLRGQHGIWIRGTYDAVPKGRGGGAEWSQIRDLAIVYRGAATAVVGHGILVEAKAKIEDVWIKGPTGHGVAIIGDVITVAEGEVRRNANMWFLSNVRVDAAGKAGFWVQGGDASAGTGVGLTSGSNCAKAASGEVCAGLVDLSFLGNTWIGFSSSTSRQCFHLGNDSQRSTMIGTYCESDQMMPSFVSQSSVVFGGLFGKTTGPGVVLVAGGPGATMKGRWGSTNERAPGNIVRNFFGDLDSPGTFREYRADADHVSWSWREKYYTTGNYAGWYGADFANSPKYTAKLQAGAKAGVPLGATWQVGPEYYGPPGARVRVGYGLVPPASTAEDWPLGSIFVNTAAFKVGDIDRWRLVSVEGVKVWRAAGHVSAE